MQSVTLGVKIVLLSACAPLAVCLLVLAVSIVLR